MAAGDVDARVTNATGLKGAYFDGVDDIVTITQTQKVLDQDLNKLAVSLWFYAPKKVLLDKGLVSHGYSSNGSWNIYMGSLGSVVSVIISKLGTIKNKSAANQYNQGAWNHIVLNWDGANLYTWQNGVSSTPMAATETIGITADLFIGKFSSSFGNATIKNLKIFNRSLTDNEIATLYSDKTISNDGLIGEWNLTENYNDTSGYGNHGISSGSYIINHDALLATEIKAQTTAAGASGKYLMCCGDVDSKVFSVAIE